MSAVEIIVLVMSLEGLLFAALGLAMRNVQPNRFMGIRYPQTFADDRVWRETHERYGPAFARVGVGILLGGVLLVVAPLPDGVTLVAFLALSVGSLAWFVVDSWRFSRARLEHYRRTDGGSTGPEAGGAR